MKHFVTFILLLAVIALVAPMRLLAATQVVDGVEWSYSLSDGNATVTGANPGSGDLVIPATLGGSPVTAIGNRMFSGCSELTSVTIPGGIKKIGRYAFDGCSGLTSIHLPDGIIDIEGNAFQRCSSLTSVTLPDGLVNIGSVAFAECLNLTSITIPDSVMNLGSEAFLRCNELTSATISDNATIGNPFKSCGKLNEIRIHVCDMARWCTNSAFNSQLPIGASRRLFLGDVEMYQAIVPDGVTTIADEAFRKCSGLTEITIPNSVTSIGNNAYIGCTNAVIMLKAETLSTDVLVSSALNQVRGVYCYRSERAAVIAAAGFEKLFGCLDENENPTIFQAEILSTTIRDNDPNVMDVDYVVHSDSPTVNVRALAFENGERGFATILRPKTFIEGTGVNIGDGIPANVEYRLSWRIPSDWNTDFGTVSFEVLAMEPDKQLLPMHFVTIPAAEGHPKTIVSVNDLSISAFIASSEFYNSWGLQSYEYLFGCRSLFNALLWLYADGESDLTLSNGSLWSPSSELVRHAVFSRIRTFDYYPNPNSNPGSHPIGTYSDWSLNPNAFRYVFGKMGYRLLDDEDELAWINENTRLDLQPQQFRQYAVKTVEE